MSSFDEWYREYTHPDNFAPSLEEAYNAGMERAAVIASNVKAPSIPLYRVSRFTIAAKIRNEIEK